MHEEPYAQAILDLALERAGGRPVSSIRLGAGRFSTVVPASLEMFFSHLSQGTPAEGAQLIFEIIPLTLTCCACQTVLTLEIPAHQAVQPVLSAYLQAGCRCGQKQLRPSGGLTVELISMTVK